MHHIWIYIIEYALLKNGFTLVEKAIGNLSDYYNRQSDFVTRMKETTTIIINKQTLWKFLGFSMVYHWDLSFSTRTVSRIRNIYSQKWKKNCAASPPISAFLYLRVINIFPQSVLFGISIFLYCMRELSAQPLEWREGQGTAAKQWLAAVPYPPRHSCGWAEKLTYMTTIQISNLENYGS